MSYKPHQQILTFFDLSKSPTATGDIPTLRYELLNHLNTFIIPMRLSAFLRTGAFCMLKKFLKNFRKYLAFFQGSVLPRERGSTTNFQQERR